MAHARQFSNKKGEFNRDLKAYGFGLFTYRIKELSIRKTSRFRSADGYCGNREKSSRVTIKRFRFVSFQMLFFVNFAFEFDWILPGETLHNAVMCRKNSKILALHSKRLFSFGMWTANMVGSGWLYLNLGPNIRTVAFVLPSARWEFVTQESGISVELSTLESAGRDGLQVPVVPMALTNLWGSFFSRAELVNGQHVAMAPPWRRLEVQPEVLPALVAALMTD